MNVEKEKSHMPQLDGVRALAVAAVLFSHWMPGRYQFGLPWGTGVQLFFVLSGFLITGILLKNRPQETGSHLGSVLRLFYIRRFLRIFPLYYGTLAVCLILRVSPISTTWPWHVSYLSNLYYFLRTHWERSDPYRHFWSLAVEEQFYIIWPFLVLMTSRVVLRRILLGCIAGALLFRICAAQVYPNTELIHVITFSSLDALAIGGFLAFVKHFEGAEKVLRLARGMAITGLVGLVVTTALERVTGRFEILTIGHSFLLLFYGFLVAQAGQGFGPRLGNLLTLRPVLYVGKISYGLYIVHNFAPVVIPAVLAGLGISWNLDKDWPLRVALYCLFTLATAAASWHFYEGPVNRLKRFFDYSRSKAGAASQQNVNQIAGKSQTL